MKTSMILLALALTAGSFATVPASAKVTGLWGTEAGSTVLIERRKPRVPGGSGCDDPHDIIEHPECR